MNIFKSCRNYNAPLSIFDFINQNGNDKISRMKKNDINELLTLLDQYCLELRDKLELNKDVTFGMELEYENVNIDPLKTELSKLDIDKIWETKKDSSLKNGIEIISPILKDNNDTWNDLDIICTKVRPYVEIGIRSGGHIHIGAQVLGDKVQSWLNFINLWSAYENVIFRFAYGEFLTARMSIMEHARPASRMFYKDYMSLIKEKKDLEDILYTISYSKYWAVNFLYVRNPKEYEEGNTIEFRCPNSSIEPVIWQNNTNLFVHILEYSKSSKYNNDVIEKRRKIKPDSALSIGMYNEIYLNQALELCDLIFDNNKDKIYFLRQYIKSFEVSTELLARPKQFIKTR